LPIAINPHDYTLLAPGVAVGYRRCKGPGRWQVRVANGKGGYWFRVVGIADDHEEADNQHVLSWFQAQDRALAIARGKDGAADSAPVTVDQALIDYASDLKAHGRDVTNARRVRRHLSPTLLGKPVAMLRDLDLRRWRNGLVEAGVNPATVSRTARSFRRALNLAAKSDPRITNRDAWRDALGKLPDNLPREFVVSDDTVLKLIAAAWALDAAFGLLIEVAAQTGARMSQLARIKIADLHDDGTDPRLGIPPSRKGHSRKRMKQIAVPITASLAAKLRQAAGKRPASEPLLLKSDGTPWQPKKSEQRDMFATIAAQVGLPDATMYLLRHALICRQILAGVALALIADNADTSTGQIESAYGWFINKHKKSDALTRGALLDLGAPTGDNVVPIQRPRRG
jgi:integrase